MLYYAMGGPTDSGVAQVRFHQVKEAHPVGGFSGTLSTRITNNPPRQDKHHLTCKFLDMCLQILGLLSSSPRAVRSNVTYPTRGPLRVMRLCESWVCRTTLIPFGAASSNDPAGRCSGGLAGHFQGRRLPQFRRIFRRPTITPSQILLWRIMSPLSFFFFTSPHAPFCCLADIMTKWVIPALCSRVTQPLPRTV